MTQYAMWSRTKKCVLWISVGFVLLLIIAINSDPKRDAARATRDAMIDRCAETWLNPRVMGYQALPRTWAGINEAITRCTADINALAREAARK